MSRSSFSSIYSNSNFVLHFQQIFSLRNFQLSGNGALGFPGGVVTWLHTCTEHAKKILTQGFFYAPTIRTIANERPWYVPFSPVYPRFLHSSFVLVFLLYPLPHISLHSSGYQLRLLTAAWGGDERLRGTWDFLNGNLWQMSFYYLFPYF